MAQFRAYHERKQDGVHVFVATTGGAKRDGLALDMSKGTFDNYLRNPVFLWAHDYQGRTLPIGKTVRLVTSKTKWRAHVVFDQEDEFARQVERKYDEGYLSAVSVGWMNQEDGTWDLLDISAVPVPGDADALMERELVLLRSFLGEHETRTVVEVDMPDDEDDADHSIEEPEVVTEDESAPDAAIPPQTRAQLGELVDERVKALAEAIAAYNQTEEQPAVEPPVDTTADTLKLLNDTLKEIV